MLTDDKVAAEKGLTDYYPASYFGMAKAYQAYLTSPFSTGTEKEAAENQTSILKRLSSSDVESTLPLYIETFGCMDTVKKILSVPVTVSVALTSFEDVQSMYAFLLGENVKNVNSVRRWIASRSNTALPINEKAPYAQVAQDAFSDYPS